jgi:hypothetical protein
MSACVSLPFYGKYCVGDLIVNVGGYSVDLLHPGVIVTLLLGSVIYIYVFKSPT